jgi:hypothetical protein
MPKDRKPAPKGNSDGNPQSYADRRSSNALESFPILKYGNNNNYHTFKDQLTIYAQREFGMLARLFETNQYFQPPLPPIPIIPNGAPQLEEQLLMMEYTEKRKLRTKAIFQMEEQRPKLFAVIWGNLSNESKDKIKEDPDWAAIEQAQDPLRLWVRLTATHIMGEARIGPINIEMTRQAYNRLQQGPAESIVAFKKRFDESLLAIGSTGAALPPQQEQASHFLICLDPHRYGQLRVTMENNVGRGLENFPDTVTAMFAAASRFKVLTNAGNVINAAAFVAREKQKKPAVESNKSSKTDQSQLPRKRLAVLPLHLVSTAVVIIGIAIVQISRLLESLLNPLLLLKLWPLLMFI